MEQEIARLGALVEQLRGRVAHLEAEAAILKKIALTATLEERIQRLGEASKGGRVEQQS